MPRPLHGATVAIPDDLRALAGSGSAFRGIGHVGKLLIRVFDITHVENSPRLNRRSLRSRGTRGIVAEIWSLSLAMSVNRSARSSPRRVLDLYLAFRIRFR